MVGADEAGAAKSFRNIPRVTVAQADAAGVADVIGAASLVITEAALEELEERATEPKRSRRPRRRPKAASQAEGGSEAEGRGEAKPSEGRGQAEPTGEDD